MKNKIQIKISTNSIVLKIYIIHCAVNLGQFRIGCFIVNLKII